MALHLTFQTEPTLNVLVSRFKQFDKPLKNAFEAAQSARLRRQSLIAAHLQICETDLPHLGAIDWVINARLASANS